MNSRILTSLLALLFSAHVALADIVCDGVDDYLDTTVNIDVFFSNTTGTLMTWYKPTGTASSTGNTDCVQGEFLTGDDGAYMGLYRSNDLGGNPRLCTFNYDGSSDWVESAYTEDAWTHLVWVHDGSNNLLFYKDGALVTSTPSGNTQFTALPLRMCIAGTSVSPAIGEGTFAEVQVFPTALSANEIASIAGSHMYRIASSAPSGSWELSSCGEGVDCTAIAFGDRSGNNRPFTATGSSGAPSAYVTYPWGVD